MLNFGRLHNLKVSYQVLMAMSITIAVFRDVAPQSLVGNNQCFKLAYCLHRQGNVSPTAQHPRS